MRIGIIMLLAASIGALYGQELQRKKIKDCTIDSGARPSLNYTVGSSVVTTPGFMSCSEFVKFSKTVDFDICPNVVMIKKPIVIASDSEYELKALWGYHFNKATYLDTEEMTDYFPKVGQVLKKYYTCTYSRQGPHSYGGRTKIIVKYEVELK